MNEEQKYLGMGLDSLFGDSKAKSYRSGILELPLEELVPGQYQPRHKMHKATLKELAESI